MKRFRVPKKAKWIVIALLIANEIRGVIVVATIGWPMLKVLHGN